MKTPYVDERARERLAQMPVPRRALFLDRDGVINVDTGHPHRADQIEWLPGIFELVRSAWADGYVPIVVTNQAGIAKGYYDEAAFLELTRWIHAAFEQAGAPLLATYYCPHHAEGLVRLLRGKCACRKPEPGLLLQAIADWDIDPGLSMLLGDKDSDIKAARRAGVADARLVAGPQEWRAPVPAAEAKVPPSEYEQRMAMEKSRFDAEIVVHDLPDIFHYWSHKYLRPIIEGFGYKGFEDFFAKEIARTVTGRGDTLLITSVGCGDCDVELQVARRLVEAGVENFRMTCIDISDEALARGRARIAEAGLTGRVDTLAHDFNRGLPAGRVDVVMANQSLHHVVELECLFASIRDQLAPGGCFLVSDVIGRNGHQRWPEARELIDQIWEWMPARYRFHCQLNRQEDRFMDWDCSKEGFEGIRAQDVLPLLLENFHPSLFASWGNLVDVFVDRGFGHHFRAQSEWDLHFVDRVQAIDSESIASGRIKPTHLLARFQREACECVHLPGMPPQFALRPVPIRGSGK